MTNQDAWRAAWAESWRYVRRAHCEYPLLMAPWRGRLDRLAFECLMARRPPVARPRLFTLGLVVLRYLRERYDLRGKRACQELARHNHPPIGVARAGIRLIRELRSTASNVK